MTSSDRPFLSFLIFSQPTGRTSSMPGFGRTRVGPDFPGGPVLPGPLVTGVSGFGPPPASIVGSEPQAASRTRATREATIQRAVLVLTTPPPLVTLLLLGL